MFTSEHVEQLNTLFKREFNGEKLTKSEHEHKNYLLNLWQQDYDEKERKLWIASQPV